MHQIHNVLRRSSYSAAFSKAVGDTREGGVERYSETLQGVLDLWGRPEFALLRGENLWSGFQSVGAGGAGTFARLGIFNPAGSGLLVVVTHHLLQVAVSGTDSVQLFPTNILLGNTATVFFRDRRDRRSVGAVLHFEASATALADQLFALTPLTTAAPVQLEIVLPPGQGFLWRISNDAAGLNGGFIGYQRQLLETENFEIVP